jgi:hypothetical protein
MFGGCGFEQTVGIPMGTNCAPLPADLFLYFDEADFIKGLSDFADCIYLIELEIKDTTDVFLHTLTYTSNLTVSCSNERNFTIKEMV